MYISCLLLNKYTNLKTNFELLKNELDRLWFLKNNTCAFIEHFKHIYIHHGVSGVNINPFMIEAFKYSC